MKLHIFHHLTESQQSILMACWFNVPPTDIKPSSIGQGPLLHVILFSLPPHYFPAQTLPRKAKCHKKIIKRKKERLSELDKNKSLCDACSHQPNQSKSWGSERIGLGDTNYTFAFHDMKMRRFNTLSVGHAACVHWKANHVTENKSIFSQSHGNLLGPDNSVGWVSHN